MDNDDVIMTLRAEKKELIEQARSFASIAATRALTDEEKRDMDEVVKTLGDHEDRLCTLEKAGAMDDEPDGDEDGHKKEDEQPAVENKSVGVGRKTSLPQSMRDGRDYKSYMNKREYRGSRVIDAVMAHRTLDGLEGEVSQEIAIRGRKQPLGAYIPFDLAELNSYRNMERRADFTTTSGAGMYFKEWGPLIEFLYPLLVTARAGVKFLSGLEGQLVLPRQDTASTPQVVAEENSADASTPTVGSITLTPRTISANVTISRRLAMNSSVDANALVMEDLARQVAIKLDSQFFLGSGSGQESYGVLYDPAITNTISNSDGSALTYAQAIELVGKVKQANVPMDSSCAWITSPLGEVTLRTTPRIGTTFPIYIEDDNNQVSGYPVYTSSIVPNNFTVSGHGSAFTAVMFGAWDQFIIAQWGAPGLDLISDPYSLSTAGSTRITALLDFDHAPRHPLAAAYCMSEPTS